MKLAVRMSPIFRVIFHHNFCVIFYKLRYFLNTYISTEIMISMIKNKNIMSPDTTCDLTLYTHCATVLKLSHK